MHRNQPLLRRPNHEPANNQRHVVKLRLHYTNTRHILLGYDGSAALGRLVEWFEKDDGVQWRWTKTTHVAKC